ncbi:MAG: DUF2752 domain-containing protein [Anaerocolumna sp.]
MKARGYKVIYYAILMSILGMAYYLFGRFTGFYIPCFFRLATGLYCPGCGSTRMSIAIIEGQFLKAFRSNEALFLLLPFLAYILVRYLVMYIKGSKAVHTKVEKIMIGVMLVVLVVFGIVRNIPYFFNLRP